MSFLKKYLVRYWPWITTSIVCLVIEAFCDLLQPTIMSRIIDVGVANHDLTYVLRLGGLMLLITATGAIGAVGRNLASSNASQRIGADLRLDLFKKIQKLSLGSLNKFDTASLITRLTNDVTQIQEVVHRMMRIFIRAPILAIGGIIMAIYLHPPMSLVLAVVVPIVASLIYLNMRIGYPYFGRVQKAIDRLNSVMREYLAGLRVVRAFNRLDYEADRMQDATVQLAKITKTAMRVMAVFSPGIRLTVNLGIAVVLWFSGYLIDLGSMEVGKTIAFINYMTQILHSLMMISRIIMMLVRAKASIDRVEEVFLQEDSMHIKADPVRDIPALGKVEFKNVCFVYHGAEQPILDRISFVCQPGQTLAIIGSTGAGKTTLVNLIPRFYDVSDGQVLVDGVDVRDYQLRDLRERIAIVPQKTSLFTGTILENIKWGNNQATEDEVIEAAKVAQAHDFISSFPGGYQTVLGQGGVNLSGGQKQRIAIARALIRKPEILILDDSTSAVDLTTESKIRQGLQQYTKDLTTIIIAQRITSVISADQIIVLDQGQIVGIGNHETLLETCPVYQDIFRSQIGTREAL